MADAILSQLGSRLDLFMAEGTDFDFSIAFSESLTGWTNFAAQAKDRNSGELVTIDVDDTNQAGDELVLLLEDVALTSGSRWQFTGTDSDGLGREITSGYCYVRAKVEADE